MAPFREDIDGELFSIDGQAAEIISFVCKNSGDIEVPTGTCFPIQDYSGGLRNM